jgi:phospholipase/carboxylesterase
MREQLLSTVKTTSDHNITASVVWLHGLGADGHDFEPVVDELRLPETLGVRFVFPHATPRPITINQGYVMRAWYDIVGYDFSCGVDAAGIRASQQQVEKLIAHEIAQGITPSRIVLAGFSQGGVIALETGLRYPEKLAGIIALSTYVALPAELPAARDPIPILMAHGTRDTVVPYALAMHSRRVLESKGYAVDWLSYPMPHSVCAEEIAAIREWLLQRL